MDTLNLLLFSNKKKFFFQQFVSLELRSFVRTQSRQKGTESTPTPFSHFRFHHPHPHTHTACPAFLLFLSVNSNHFLAGDRKWWDSNNNKIKQKAFNFSFLKIREPFEILFHFYLKFVCCGFTIYVFMFSSSSLIEYTIRLSYISASTRRKQKKEKDKEKNKKMKWMMWLTHTIKQSVATLRKHWRTGHARFSLQ